MFWEFGLEYRPVTPGVAGSSPVHSAKIPSLRFSNLRLFRFSEKFGSKLIIY